MQGGSVDHRNPLPGQWRTYQLIKITGWTVDQIDEAPAEMCDWILRLHRVEAEVQAEADAKTRR